MASNKSLIYSFVARGTVVLAEHSVYAGNFSTIAIQLLDKLPANSSKPKLTYTCDGHTFNYLVDDGFTYLVVATEAFEIQVPYAFLDRVKEDFKRRYGGGRAETAGPYSMVKEFGPRLKEHMSFATEHPEELDKLTRIRSQVDDVKATMMGNIEKVLDRQEKLDVVVEKSDTLYSQASDYRQQGVRLRRKMWFQNMKAKLVVLAIIICLALIIWLSVCHGFNCK